MHLRPRVAGAVIARALLALLPLALVGAPCATPLGVVYFPPDPEPVHPAEIVVQQETADATGTHWIDSGGRVREGDCTFGEILLLANLRSCYVGEGWEVCSDRTRHRDCAVEPCAPVEETCAAGDVWSFPAWALLSAAPAPPPEPEPQPEPELIPLPQVLRQRLIDCASFAVLAEIVSPDQVVSIGPLPAGACVGLATFVDALTASIGYDYSSVPEQPMIVPWHGELNPPFCFTGDAGWQVSGQIPKCTADPAKANLAMPGEHVLTVTPCSVDPPAWGAGSKTEQCVAAGGVPGASFTTTLAVAQ